MRVVSLVAGSLAALLGALWIQRWYLLGTCEVSLARERQRGAPSATSCAGQGDASRTSRSVEVLMVLEKRLEAKQAFLSAQQASVEKALYELSKRKDLIRASIEKHGPTRNG